MFKDVKIRMLEIGSKIGILGGGQLGRYLAQAAADLGFSCHIYCPDNQSPAFEVASYHTVADYDDKEELSKFASNLDVVTYEFENIPIDCIDILSKTTNIFPPSRALEISQDRLKEKTFLNKLSIPLGAFRKVDNPNDLLNFCKEKTLPVVLKQRRFGYDGKGQYVIKTKDELDNALLIANKGNMIVEEFIEFSCEISVIIARSTDGEYEVFTPGTNTHINNILDTTLVPSKVGNNTINQAKDIAIKIAQSFDYVGVLGVEFFVLNNKNNKSLLVNEFAPRVHNSGHWTMDGDIVSQFEQHIRAISGWSLRKPRLLAPTLMKNIIGSEIKKCTKLVHDPEIILHLYGKKESRADRKMGHYNKLLK